MFVVFGELGVNCKVGSLGYQRYDGKEKEKQIHIVTFVTLLGVDKEVNSGHIACYKSQYVTWYWGMKCGNFGSSSTATQS